MGIKKYCFPVLFVLILSITAISCASTPPETETKVDSQTETVQEDKTISEITTPQNAKVYFDKMAEEKKSAESSKHSADKAKAYKGDPENYETAENLFSKAMISEEKEDFQTASETYYQADEAYQLSIIKTEENKLAALEAMRAMENAISNTEKKAEDAVKEAEQEDER